MQKSVIRNIKNSETGDNFDPLYNWLKSYSSSHKCSITVFWHSAKSLEQLILPVENHIKNKIFFFWT